MKPRATSRGSSLPTSTAPSRVSASPGKRRGLSLRKKVLSKGEETFALQCRAIKVPMEREYRFHEERMWRVDFAFHDFNLAVEIEGGAGFGRHSRREGFTNDCRKYNALTLAGWRLLRFTTAMVMSGEAINTVVAALAGGKVGA